LIVIAIGVAVLLGWSFQIDRLMTVVHGSIRMKPNTAVALLAAAVAILLEWRHADRWLRRAVASVPLLIGAATLFEYFSGVSLRIDQLFFHDPVQTVYPGRMAHLTAANLVCIGAALLCLSARPRRIVAAHTLTVLCGLTSLFAIVGHAYGVPMLYGSLNYTAMAFHTGVSFLLLALATLFVHADVGVAARFWSSSSGGFVARRLLPLAIVVPIALGAIFVQPRFNFGELRFGLALNVMSSMIIMVTLITKLARSLGNADRARLEAVRNSTTDDLTRTYNRRYFDQRLSDEMDRSSRSGAPLSIVLLDIDHFKNFNDEHGHVVGDSVLRWTASVATRALRTSSVLCRYGGEEFAIIVPDATLHDATAVAERVRSAIARTPWPEHGLTVTVSAGVAEWSPLETARSVVRRADEALYLAKKNGRDRVESLATGPREIPRDPPLVAAS
jgi:diguanylate cyclase (GGDEF)-like protein